MDKDFKGEFSENIATERLIKNVAKGGMIVFVGSIFGKLLTVLLHIVLSRGLGVADYGLYALAMSIFIIVGKISLLGLPMGVLRFCAYQKGEGDIEKVKGTIFASFSIVIAVSIIISAIFFLFFYFLTVNVLHKANLSPILKIFLLALPFYNIMVMSYFAIRAFKKMNYYVCFRDILKPLLNIIIVLIAFLLGYRLGGAAYSFLTAIILSAIISISALRYIIPELISSIKPVYEVRRLLRFSMPILLIGLSFMLLNQISRIIIGYFEFSDKAGIYNVAATITALIVIFLNCIDAIFAPLISDLYKKREIKRIDTLFKTSTRWVFSLSLPITILYILFSKEIMSLFGADFVNGYIVLIILAAAYLFNAITGSVAFLLQMSGKQDIELFNSIGIVTLCIILNIFFVKSYGILGAAIATGASIALINLVRLIEVKKILNIQPYDRKYLKSLLSAALMVVVYFAIAKIFPIYWPIKIVILLTSYFCILLALRLEEEDRIVLGAIGKKLFSHK